MQATKKITSKSQTLAIKNIALTKLNAHPDNPRQHSKGQIRQIANSIKEFGFRIPILVDGDNRLICGHGRVEAAKAIGLTEVPAIVVDDLSEAQVRALMIADNRLTELSDWDTALLGKNFQILSDLNLNFDLDITGFDYGVIEQFIIGDSPSKIEAETVDLSPAPIACSAGDLWRLGNHVIFCGDARDKSSYSVLLGDKKASLIFTDPPYNISAKTIGKVCARKHGNFVSASGEMSPDEFTQFLSAVFTLLCRFSQLGSIHFIFMDWRHVKELLDAGLSCYSEYKNLCVWAKDRVGMGSFYRSQHELVFVFKNGNAKHQNNFLLGQHGRTRSNLWEFPSVRGLSERDGDETDRDALALHPTIKPVRLIEEALLDCSRRGHIVLDPFLGSGSTLIACEKTKRHCYGIEYNPVYVDAALYRFHKLTGIEPIHVVSGQTYSQRIKSLKGESS
jgi:DNA modification methylase